MEDASAACVVMVNEFATEGEDRPGLADPVSFTLKMACLELKNDPVFGSVDSECRCKLFQHHW